MQNERRDQQQQQQQQQQWLAIRASTSRNAFYKICAHSLSPWLINPTPIRAALFHFSISLSP
jgi:hypothetical protein